jgi:hypothetical protein
MLPRLANPAELERAGKRLERGAAELEHLRKELVLSARRPDWVGDGGDSMRGKLDGFVKDVARAEAELRHMAHDLRVGAHHVRDEREDHRHDDRPDDNELVARRERMTEFVAQRDEVAFEQAQAELVAQHLASPRIGTSR